MLLVPIKSYGLEHARAAPNNINSSSIETLPYNMLTGRPYQQIFGVAAENIAFRNSSYLMSDVMGYPHLEEFPQRVPSLPNDRISMAQQHDMIRPTQRHSPSASKSEKQDSILYNLLNKPDKKMTTNTHFSLSDHHTMQPLALRHINNFSRVTRICVGLSNAVETHRSSTRVLDKTINFVKSLESFKNLGTHDQELLFSNCWAELFIVGMAQEKVVFDIVQYEISIPTSDPSSKDSSFNKKESIKIDEGEKLKNFLHRCEELQLTAVEYAYFMGTVLFDPDVTGLDDRDTIAALQIEAIHALAEYRGERINSTSQFDAEHHQQMRLAQILLGLPALRSIKTQAVVDLFFRSYDCCSKPTII